MDTLTTIQGDQGTKSLEKIELQKEIGEMERFGHAQNGKKRKAILQANPAAFWSDGMQKGA
jgi:hypothetical protein